MIALRSALFLVLLGVGVVVYGAAIGTVGRLIGEQARGRLGRSWAQLTLWLLARICGLHFRAEGLDRLPEQACLVFCKHQSAWETIALRALLPLRQTWVLKRELMRIPFFGWGVAAFRPIAIDRSAGRQAMRQLLAEGAAHLREGRWIVIFPEGTRVAPGETKRFTVGGALLAERTGSVVVPIAHNAGVFWRRRGFLKHPGCIQLVVGPPIDCRNKRAAEINEIAEDWINATVAALPGDRESGVRSVVTDAPRHKALPMD